MGSFIDNLYDVLFHPAAAMRRIAAEKPLGQSLAAFVISVLIPAGAFYLAFETGEQSKMPAAMIPILTLGSMIAWFCEAAILNLVAEFLGGQGTAKGLLTALGFACLPRILVVPVFVLAMLFPGGLMSVLAGMATLISFFWVLILEVAAIKGAHDLGNARAVMVLVIPWLVIGAAILAFMLFAGAALMSELML